MNNEVSSVSGEIKQPGTGPAKYRVFEAARAMWAAIRTNGRTYVAVASLSVAAVIVVTVVASVSLTLLAPAIQSNAAVLISVVLTVIAAVVLATALAGALLQNATSLALADGAEGRTGGIGATMRQGWNKVLRVSLVNVLIIAAAAGPMIVAYALLLVGTVAGNGSLTVLSGLLALAGVAWLIVAALWFALAPVVALFEPDVSVVRTLARSRQLLGGSERWFIVKGVVLVIVVSLIASALTGNLQQGSSSNPMMNVLSMVLSLFLSGIFVMLYRHRVSRGSSRAE